MICMTCGDTAVRNFKCAKHLKPILPDPPHDPAAHQASTAAWAERRRREEYERRPAPATDTQPLVVIPCGSAKATVASRPAELYVSPHFRMGARAALALTTPDRVLILSARYGLVCFSLPDLFDPYDKTIVASTARRDTERVHRNQVAFQRSAWRLDAHSNAVGLLPQRYLRVARAAFPDIVDALAGCRGIFDQRARLARIIENGTLT